MTFAVAVTADGLTPYDLEEGQLVSGTPVTSDRTLWEAADGTAIRGIWSCTPGSIRLEESEMFVVVGGRATVHPDYGAPFEISPGDAVVLERTHPVTLEVHETLLKAYHMELTP